MTKGQYIEVAGNAGLQALSAWLIAYSFGLGFWLVFGWTAMVLFMVRAFGAAWRGE